MFYAEKMSVGKLLLIKSKDLFTFTCTVVYLCLLLMYRNTKTLEIMTTLNFKFETIQEVQTKQTELKLENGSDNVTMNLDRDDFYFHASFNIFK